MIKATLIRKESSDSGTFGIFNIFDLAWYSGELPWKDNRPNLSCIQAGRYQCYQTYSPRFKKRLYLIDGVEGRTGLRFHAANLMGDRDKGLKAQLNGCIALGEKLGTIDGQKALLVSSPAIRRFEAALNGRPFELEIMEDN